MIKWTTKNTTLSKQIQLQNRYPNTHIHFLTWPLYFLACYMHFNKKKNSDRVALVIWAQASFLSEMLLIIPLVSSHFLSIILHIWSPNMTCHRMGNMCNTTVATGGAGTTYPSRLYEFVSRFSVCFMLLNL